MILQFRNFQTECEPREVETAGEPQLTYARIRVGDDTIAYYNVDRDAWVLEEDGTEWTDVVMLVDAPLNGVYLVHREEEDEPLWAFESEGDADTVVYLLKRGGTAAWASFQPIAYTLLDDDGIRETIGHVLGGVHSGLLTPEGSATEKLVTLIAAAESADAATLDEFFGAETDGNG